MKYSLFIGRWQPFHKGHEYIINQALSEGKNVCIGVRNTLISEFDPLTADQRVSMLKEVYKDDPRVKIIIMPDIESVNIGRKVGYDVIRFDAPVDIEGISATKIRELMAKGDDSWKTKVPEGVVKFFDKRCGNQVYWLTGLSGSGKSTLAIELANYFKNNDIEYKVLDGDEVRDNLNSDLGFSKKDRDENIRRISWVAKLLADAGVTVIVAAISPYEEAREKARQTIGTDRFVECFIDCPLEELIKRDPKGLYAKALSGEIKNFTGVSDPYEAPTNAEIIFNTEDSEPKGFVDIVLQRLEIWGL